MDFPDSNLVDIFEIYRRYCDIRSGKSYWGQRKEQDDDTHVCKFSRDALAQLLKFIELRVHTRISIFEELAKLMSKLELMVDFSEYSRFYDFVFFMCRENGQKNITVRKAITAWRLVLDGRFRLLNQWCDFVLENQRHNISEDTWQQVLAFSRCVHENLEGYDPEGAWPVLIDDFVEHMYRISGSNKDPNIFCNCGDSESQSCLFEDPLPGLKVTPGLKRKLSNNQYEEMETSDNHLTDFTNLNLKSNSKRNRPISHGPLNWEENPPGKSPCAVEGCLSRGIAGLFSSLTYLQLDRERRLSYT